LIKLASQIKSKTIILSEAKDLATFLKTDPIYIFCPGPQTEILRGVYPEPIGEILRFAQDDQLWGSE
jgi:hypothetical protein